MEHEILMIPTDDIKPYPHNPKLHPDKQINAIAQSIMTFGFTVPIVVDEKWTVILGHGRLLAAQRLELDQCPCMIRDDLTESQIRALRIADNKVAESGWDVDTLLQELALTNEFSGFSDEEINTLSMSREEGQTDPNEEWDGMPEFDQDDGIFRSIIVHFADQDAVDQFCELVNNKISNTAKYIWFPQIVIERTRKGGENLMEYVEDEEQDSEP